jgi:ketosteroid isomerase-like protein
MLNYCRFCVTIAAAIMITGCARPDLHALRTSLLETDRQWAQVVRGSDAEGIATFWTEDAVIYTAGRPPVAGKKSLREFVARNRSIPGFALSWYVSEAVVSEAGDMAYTLGPYEITVPSSEGGLITHRGNHICMWRREAGQWRCNLEVHAPLPTADERMKEPGSR